MDNIPENPYWSNQPRRANGFAQDAFYMGLSGLQRNRFRSRRRGCCLPTVLITLIVIAILAVTGFSNGWMTNLLHTGPVTLKVSDHPKLIVRDTKYVQAYSPTPSIAVHSSKNTTSMRIETTNRWLLSDPLSYQQSHNGDTTIVTVGSQYEGRVDITVPINTDLTIDTNSATIDITQVTGQMILQSNSGSITVKDSFISGPSLIGSNSGSIKLQNTRLSDGQVNIENNTGPINFEGIIENQDANQYSFKDNQGTIDISLASNASFHLDAITLNGTLTSTFPGITGDQKVIHQNAGSSPKARLMIYSVNGSVSLHPMKGV